MRKIFTLLVSMIAALGSIQAADFTYDFSTGVSSAWTSSAQPYGAETTDLTRGTQYTTSATLTLKGVKQATKVVITCSTNVDKKNTIDVKVGSTTFGKDELLSKENDMEKTFEAAATDGDLTINITRVDKSIYIKKIVVTCDEAPEGDETGDDDNWLEDLLTPTFESEPTDKTTANLTFTQGLYANDSFEDGTPYTQFALTDETNGTFIVQIGDVKTGTYTIDDSMAPGSALASIGGNLLTDYPSYIGLNYSEEEEYYEEIYYLVSGTITVVKNGDALKIDINAKSYNGSTFTATYTGTPEEYNDDDDDDPDSDLSYDWETTKVSTQNFDFDYAESASGHDDDYDYDWTQIYLEGETWTSELLFFAPYAEGTGVAPGTYVISDSEEDGTVCASPGGDDFYDYPSNICYNYNENGYYSDVYYLVSGTVKVTKTTTGVKIEINAKSYNGSTITGTFSGTMVNATAIEKVSAESKAQEGKIMQNGQLIIKNNGRSYNASGLIMK